MGIFHPAFFMTYEHLQISYTLTLPVQIPDEERK